MNQPYLTGHGWPFIGRDLPLAEATGAVRTGGGAVVAGRAGTGKSRLLVEIAGRLTGYAVLRAAGTAPAADLPLGAFAHAVREPPPGADLLPATAAQLRAAATGDGELLVVVDDAHWLDATAAALVHHLVAQAMARVLVAVRTGERAPEPVTALWQDRLLPRVELAPLAADEVGQVLAAVLGGQVEQATVHHLARAAGGNLLYLREVVIAAQEAGTLSNVDGVWCWRGPLPVSPRLRELIERRIGRLDPDILRVLELVALGEPLGLAVLSSLTSPAATATAEQRGLVTVDTDGRRRQVRLGHPLYGEVLRDRCGQLRTRRLQAELADAVDATGRRRHEDILRVASWRLDSQASCDPELSLAAANLAWARHDPPLAARLARAALDSGGGAEAAAVLGQVLMVQGRAEEAAEVLRRVASDRVADPERAQLAMSLGIQLAWGGADGAACQVLDQAQAQVRDPNWRQELLIYRGVIDFFAGRPAGSARALAEVSALGPTNARGTAHAAGLQAWVCAYAGETARSLATVERALADATAWRDRAPHAMPTLLDAQCAGYLFAGDLAGVERVARQAVRLGNTPGNADLSVSAFSSHLAAASRLRGDAASAIRWCREDTVRLRARSPYLGRCLAELAHAAALLGELDTARQALADAEPLARPWALTHLPALLAASWLAAAEGDLDTAVGHAIAAADAAEKRGMAGYQMFALHDVVRLGSAGLVADRLGALAGRHDGPLVTLCADHAVAAAGRDGPQLRVVSAGFEELGMSLHAAEAAAQAAGAFRSQGRAASARSAETRAWGLADQCPPIRTPALLHLATPDLTLRQREIAQLAAAGLTNRQIAERLALSPRTVANHLQAAYTKLYVHHRGDLTALR